MNDTTNPAPGTRVVVSHLAGSEFGTILSAGAGRITVRFDDRTITSFPASLVQAA